MEKILITEPMVHPITHLEELAKQKNFFNKCDFWFQFIIDETAANYIENASAPIYFTDVKFLYYPPVKMTPSIALQKACADVPNYLLKMNFGTDSYVYAEQLRVIAYLQEEIDKLPFWKKYMKNYLQKKLNSLKRQKVRLDYFWPFEVAYNFFCRKYHFVTENEAQQSFKEQLSKFAVRYACEAQRILQRLTDKAGFTYKDELTSYLMEILLPNHWSLFAEMVAACPQTWSVPADALEVTIAEEWFALVYSQNMYDNLQKQDQYSFECICRQVQKERDKFTAHKTDIDTVLRALVLIYRQLPPRPKKSRLQRLLKK